jgi:hypothetical protein
MVGLGVVLLVLVLRWGVQGPASLADGPARKLRKLLLRVRLSQHALHHLREEEVARGG